LKASGGITNTLRPSSRTETSQVHCRPHTLLSRSPVLTAKSAIWPRCAGSLRNSVILLLPRDRIGRAWAFGQHRDQRRYRFEPRTTVSIAVRARGAIQDGAHDFHTVVDRRRTRATGKPRLHEGFQHQVVNLLWFEISDVRLEQSDVPLDDVDAPLTAGLRDIARRTIGKGRARMRLSREVALHSSDFDLEPFLGLFLCYRADA